MTEPWMSIEEAEAWCDAARAAILDRFPGTVGWLASAREDLRHSFSERTRIADEYDAASKWPSHSPYTRNVLTFCAAVLRAVKEANDASVYSYEIEIVVPLPYEHERSALVAINVAHGWTPSWEDAGTAQLNEAHWMLRKTQTTTVTVDVYADGSRKIRGV